MLYLNVKKVCGVCVGARILVLMCVCMSVFVVSVHGCVYVCVLRTSAEVLCKKRYSLGPLQAGEVGWLLFSVCPQVHSNDSGLLPCTLLSMLFLGVSEGSPTQATRPPITESQL